MGPGALFATLLAPFVILANGALGQYMIVNFYTKKQKPNKGFDEMVLLGTAIYG